MCRYEHLQGSWSQFLLGDNIEPEYGVSLRQTWGTSRPKIYTLNSKLSRKLFMGRSLLYLYTDHCFEKIKPVSYDNFNLCALKLLRWCMSYLGELGCPSLLAGSFSQLRNSVPLSWGCPHQGHLWVYSPGSLLELGPRPAILHVPCALCSHQMRSVLCFSYYLLYFLTFCTWFARREILKALHFSFPPSFVSPTRLFFPILLGSSYFSIYLAHAVCG